MLTNTMTLHVAFGDCDPAGIVFYPNFFRWCDMGFGRLIQASGADVQTARRFPLLETGSSFKAPAAFGDELQLVSQVSELRSKIVRVSHSFQMNGSEIATCWEVRVWVMAASLLNPRALKAEAIPDNIAALLRGEKF